MKSVDNLIEKLSKRPIQKDVFFALLSKCETTYENVDLEIELLKSNGLPIELVDDNYILTTSLTNIENQIFCIVDIETNGNSPKHSQIIEIGAVKIKNGKIIDTYESLIYTKEIPEYISQVTGIYPQMTTSSPALKVVLEEFKIFLEDSVFVAHNVSFDYKFISESMELFDLGKLQNRKICTIDLSKRLILAPKYGLEALKEILQINLDHHRAMSDAKSCALIFEHCIKLLPSQIKTTEELIGFSKSQSTPN